MSTSGDPDKGETWPCILYRVFQLCKIFNITIDDYVSIIYIDEIHIMTVFASGTYSLLRFLTSPTLAGNISSFTSMQILDGFKS